MLKRSLIAASIAAAVLVLQSVNNADDKKEEKFTAKCPVSGGAAKKDASIDYLGKKLYFCCNNCPKAFEKDTKKYSAKANHQLLQTKQLVQVACPFSGEDLNPETAIEVAGVKVAFCCGKCKGKAEKSDDKIAMIFTKLDKGFTLQTTCPVSGKPIKADKVVEHKGKKVYFCCPGCPAAFEANPEKFLGTLPQFKKTDKES